MDDSETESVLRCIESDCLTSYPIDRLIYACEKCGGLLDVSYQFSLSHSADELKKIFLQRRTTETPADLSGVWRFRELLPFLNDPSHIVTLREGNTPVYAAPESATHAGMNELRFKHLGLNPTGSFKDYGMTTGVSQARRLGAGAVACASTGNTSASMAAYAARAGMRGFVFIPAGKVALGKLSQSIEYGSTVVEIEGNFDDAMRLVRSISEECGIYLLNSINPFRLEGQKAIAIELMEQLEWNVPDWIVLPGGNLGNVSSIGKGLRELLGIGLIRSLPKIALIQAEGASPFYHFFSSGAEGKLKSIQYPYTLATAISIGSPVSWKRATRALRWTEGAVERVSEQQIADAKAQIGLDGIGCEPASAATLAGIKKLVESGTIARTDRVVGILTGNVLKDPSYTVAYHSRSLQLERDGGTEPIQATHANQPVRVAADETEIKRALLL